MERKCQGCRVRVRLRGEGGKPGATIRFTCPRCGDLNTTALPGNPEADRVIGMFDDALDRAATVMGPDWRERYAPPRAQA